MLNATSEEVSRLDTHCMESQLNIKASRRIIWLKSSLGV